jgi:hypothetical protein
MFAKRAIFLSDDATRIFKRSPNLHCAPSASKKHLIASCVITVSTIARFPVSENYA